MKLITTVIRPERLPHVKAALFRAGVTGITISRVSGHGGERELLETYRGTTVVLEFREKVRIEMACSEPFVEPTIKAILSAGKNNLQSVSATIKARVHEDLEKQMTEIEGIVPNRKVPA